MKIKRSIRFAKVISLVVTAAGLAVIAGWIFDIGVLKSISPAWVSMKFSAAIAFVASGATLYFLARALEGAYEKAMVALSITALVIALIMGLLFFSTIFNIPMGLENLFIRETGAVKSVASGRPAVPTMINFMLMALAAILAILNPVRLGRQLRTIGSIIGFVGIMAVAGYIFNVPLLYYYLAGVSSAMALHTAVLFVLLGTGMLCL